MGCPHPHEQGPQETTTISNQNYLPQCYLWQTGTTCK